MSADLLQHLRIDPDPEQWRTLARTRFDRLDDRARQFRIEMGLPTDRPIVMTGHQATFWHPGVLSKYLAAEIAATSFGFDRAWLVADQDIHEHGTLLAPVLDPEGRLEAIGVLIMGCAGSGVATGSCAPFAPQEPALDRLRYALRSVDRGMRSIIDSLRRCADEPTAARQIARASQELIRPHLDRAPSVFASELARTTVFREIVERLASEPELAVEHYNQAALRFPRAGIAPLALDGDEGGVELPLWSLQRGAPRHRVHVGDIDVASPGLAPRAILMSAIIRMAACDLFIVGSGGEIYDQVTEQWIERWLGASLAPRVLVTADLLLPLDETGASEADLHRAVWKAHSARHNPALLDDREAAQQKRKLVESIARARSEGRPALPAFKALHEMLDEYRAQHADALLELTDRSLELAQRADQRRIARDRTWAFPLHGPESLAKLRCAIENRFAASPMTCGTC